MFLRCKENRMTALHKDVLKMLGSPTAVTRSLSRLFDLCATNAVQFEYLLLLCIWLISFVPEAAPLFRVKQYNLVTELARSLNTYDSEKVIRVVVAIVQNLIKHPALTEELISCGAIRKLNLLNQRVFKDKDISETLKVVIDVLNANYDVLTSFDLYVKELASGVLRRGPRHTDDFWKENVRAFEFEDFKYLKELIALLASADAETVCVACGDIGAFAVFYPNGRK